MAKAVAACALVWSVSAGLWLNLHHVTLSGPGDQLSYYTQAQRLIPFIDHWYGPGYFVALRVVHDLLGYDWLAAGKLIGFVSTLGIITICWFLFRRVFRDPALAWLATALLALNPELIRQMYSDLTIPFGAVWVLAAVTTIIGARVGDTRRWLLAGALFGAGALVRFQTFGFLLGASAGTMFLDGPWLKRLRAGAILLGMGIIPTVAWKLFLISVQGAPPENWNFVTLTMATGEFQSFVQVKELAEKYGSFWGLIRSDGTLLPRLLANAVAETVRFPLGVGSRILGPTTVWLGPGLIAALFDRRFWLPWATALCVGFLLTLPTQPWSHYFVPLLPLFVIVLVWGVEIPGRDVRPRLVAAGWIALLAGAVVWSAYRVPRDFAASEWKELAVAKEYLNREPDGQRVVSSTSSSIWYGANFQFLDFDEIWRGRDDLGFVGALRAAGVTHLVVTARHTLDGYPSQAVLLADSVTSLPLGLVRDTLIVTPQRLAIFHVQP